MRIRIRNPFHSINLQNMCIWLGCMDEYKLGNHFMATGKLCVGVKWGANLKIAL